MLISNQTSFRQLKGASFPASNKKWSLLITGSLYVNSDKCTVQSDRIQYDRLPHGCFSCSIPALVCVHSLYESHVTLAFFFLFFLHCLLYVSGLFLSRRLTSLAVGWKTLTYSNYWQLTWRKMSSISFLFFYFSFNTGWLRWCEGGIYVQQSKDAAVDKLTVK